MMEDEHLEADYEDRTFYEEEAEEEDYEIDWEIEERKRDFLEFSRSHPNIAFTGESVSNFINYGGDLESGGEEHIEEY